MATTPKLRIGKTDLSGLGYTDLLKKKKKLGLYDPLSLNNTGTFKGFNTPELDDAATLKTTTATTPTTDDDIDLSSGDATVDDLLSRTYQNDLKNLELSKKFLIGSTAGQGLLNLTNLAQINKKLPRNVGVETIPNVEYPSPIGPGLADISNAVGRYRSGARRIGAERGYNPSDIMRGVEANVLDTELSSRAKLAEQDIANKQAEKIANSNIATQNIANRYGAATDAQTRNDLIAANRSELFSKGLDQIASLGTNLGEGLITLDAAKGKASTTNEYLRNYLTAKTDADRLAFATAYIEGGGNPDYIDSQYISTNIPLTNKDFK